MSGKGAHHKEERKKTARKSPMRDRLGRLLGIPADAVGVHSGFMAEMRGRSSLTVKGCRKILRYSKESIRLQTRDGEVEVVGEGLFCIAYFTDSIGIEGRIDGVIFCDGCAARRDAT